MVYKDMEELLVTREMGKVLQVIISKLKPKYRDVLTYRLFLELHFSKIAEIMNISENSAKVIYFRGKQLIKKEMEEFHYGK